MYSVGGWTGEGVNVFPAHSILLIKEGSLPLSGHIRWGGSPTWSTLAFVSKFGLLGEFGVFMYYVLV